MRRTYRTTEARRRSAKRYADKNRDKMKAYAHSWQERNRERTRSYTRSRTRKIRAFATRWKLAAGCIDCGYSAHPAALDFDHVGEKRFNVGSAPSLRRLVAEISRCEARCANCHRIKTRERAAA